MSREAKPEQKGGAKLFAAGDSQKVFRKVEIVEVRKVEQ